MEIAILKVDAQDIAAGELQAGRFHGETLYLLSILGMNCSLKVVKFSQHGGIVYCTIS